MINSLLRWCLLGPFVWNFFSWGGTYEPTNRSFYQLAIQRFHSLLFPSCESLRTWMCSLRTCLGIPCLVGHGFFFHWECPVRLSSMHRSTREAKAEWHTYPQCPSSNPQLPFALRDFRSLGKISGRSLMPFSEECLGLMIWRYSIGALLGIHITIRAKVCIFLC